jgi:hypothetical protein
MHLLFCRTCRSLCTSQVTGCFLLTLCAGRGRYRSTTMTFVCDAHRVAASHLPELRLFAISFCLCMSLFSDNRQTADPHDVTLAHVCTAFKYCPASLLLLSVTDVDGAEANRIFHCVTSLLTCGKRVALCVTQQFRSAGGALLSTCTTCKQCINKLLLGSRSTCPSLGHRGAFFRACKIRADVHCGCHIFAQIVSKLQTGGVIRHTLVQQEGRKLWRKEVMEEVMLAGQVL